MGKKFDIFGDDVGGSGTNTEPPVIQIDHKNHISGMEIEASINRVNELCKRSVSCLKTAKKATSSNIEDLSWAVYLLEKAILQTREIAMEIGNEEEKADREIDIAVQGVEVKVLPDLITINFPSLMPKRKANLKTNYYCKTLNAALKGKKVPDRFHREMISVIFLHCYEKDHAHWARKDHDNIELKWVIDALNDHFFIDDGPFRTSLYNHSTIDEKDHTLIFLVPTEQFADFVSRQIPEWEMQKVRYQKQ